jgi:hypothetical protein
MEDKNITRTVEIRDRKGKKWNDYSGIGKNGLFSVSYDPAFCTDVEKKCVSAKKGKFLEGIFRVSYARNRATNRDICGHRHRKNSCAGLISQNGY